MSRSWSLAIAVVLVALTLRPASGQATLDLSPTPPMPPAPAAAEAESIVADQLVSAEKSKVFRYDPFHAKLFVVTPAEIKPGFLYNHYHQQLGRRVWSIADGGGYQYAMAPGSVQPARFLDLRATPQQQREALIARAPELAKIMDVRGGIAHVKLKQDETWELVKMPTIGSVFDLETGRRWEWHGERRVAVVHTGGDIWEFVDGKPIPANYMMGGGYAPGPGCW